MAQNIYQILRDLLDQIVECLGDPCPYQVFVSRGYPPADCSSIAAWYSNSNRASENQDCQTTIYDTDLKFTITHCCVTPDTGIGFDFEREEIEAECFLTNLAAIRECLSCSATDTVSQYILGCGALVTSVVADPEARGGCYSATVTIAIEEDDCCV